MATSRVSVLLIFIGTFSLFNTNYALNQAEILKKVIRSPRQINNPLFDGSLAVDTDPSLVITPKFIKTQHKLRKADSIVALPGQPKGVDFAQYSGYVTVNKKNGRELFYYFVESPHNSSTKPLILWLNGGPGCSSLGYGAMEEVGPFRVNRDGKTLSRNKYAWNNVANILFVESPAGVGFSKSNPEQINGDTLTAKESYVFLITWLERFPEFKNRDFFIVGESYAGHYIPQLADVILRKNKLSIGTSINLKGIAIGNAYIDKVENDRAQYEYFWRHAFISDEVYKPIRKNCDFANKSSICETALDKTKIGSSYFDPYNIYAPKCLTAPDGISVLHTDDPEAGIDPCIDTYVGQYLNDVAEKKAFHVDVNAKWLPCVDATTKFYYPDSQQPETTVPTIQKIIGKGLRVWLYSGDIDSVVPIVATKNSVKSMRLPVKKEWRPWFSNQQVGGYVEEYEGLTLATVRGSGHMVPTNQPHRALDLITNFLQGKSLPEITSSDD